MQALRQEVEQLREENARLKHYELEYKIVKSRIEAIVAMLLSGQELKRLPWMLNSKAMETRASCLSKAIASTADDFALDGVKELDNPDALGRSQGVEVDIYGEGVLDSNNTELFEDGVSGCVEDAAHD